MECVQFYLYTDQAPLVTPSTCLPVIELANRLVLPRLITLLEHSVITAMREVIEDGGEVFQAALDLVDASQVHNAAQLSDWCMSYLAQNYTTITTRCHSIIQSVNTNIFIAASLTLSTDSVLTHRHSFRYSSGLLVGRICIIYNILQLQLGEKV